MFDLQLFLSGTAPHLTNSIRTHTESILSSARNVDSSCGRALFIWRSHEAPTSRSLATEYRVSPHEVDHQPPRAWASANIWAQSHYQKPESCRI